MAISSEHVPEALIFLHIPKTAGSTLHSILNNRYSNIQNVFASALDDDEVVALRNSSVEQRRNIDLLKGHMPFGLHQFLPRPARYFTMLRDPVERVVSQYFYIKKNKNNPLHNTLIKGRMSPGELVESGISVGLNNGQIRWLLGDLKKYEFDEINGFHLQSAMVNLNKYFVSVGINEMFDQSILLLARKLSWKRLPYYDRRNTNKSKAEVSEDDIKVIRKYNEYDIKLYENAVSRLTDEIDGFPEFQDMLESFRKKNNFYSFIQNPLRLFRI